MSVVLVVTTMCALALGVQGGVHSVSTDVDASHHGSRPCLRKRLENVYSTFVQQHIIQDCFDRRSKHEWEMYLQDYQLCDKSRQSFIRKIDETHVRQICDGSGRRVDKTSNLCVGTEKMPVYDVYVSRDGKCRVTSVVQAVKYVVVACDKVGNSCRPVDFKRSTYLKPSKSAAWCKPW